MVCLGNAYKCTQMYNECIKIGFKCFIYIYFFSRKKTIHAFYLYCT